MASEKELAALVKNETLPVAERRAALRLLCQLKGEPDGLVNQIEEKDLGQIACIMTLEVAGIKFALKMKDALEALTEGRARRIGRR